MINKIDMSGEWGFRLDEAKTGIEKKFFEILGDDTIMLPSTTSISKKGKPNYAAETGFLTDSYAFEGWAWYYKKCDLRGVDAECTVQLFLERTKPTMVWINGKFVGKCNSLCTPHIYDISSYAGEEITIAVCVSNTDYPTKGGHMTSPDTQSNWNGITGEISLIISEKVRISDIQAYPELDKKSVRLVFELTGTSSADITLCGASSDGKVIDNMKFHISSDSNEIIVSIGDNASLWSEYNPVTYTLKASLVDSSDIASVTFGLRSFKADGMKFTINGRETYLRGKHDGMIFPLTGAAPTTVEEWCRILTTAKKWGINHYRFHTCCPPEAAFTAADMVGIYLQPELPFWGTITSSDDENHNETEQQYLIEEGRRILSTFGNHPSFVMMSLGNELWGSSERMAEILREYHSLDNRHLYTQGSNNFQFWPVILDEDDFFSGVRLSKERLVRGSYATCDAPLGFIQTERPNTTHSYDRVIFPDADIDNASNGVSEIEIQYGTGVKKVRVNNAVGGLVPSKPIVTHEVGQYCTYPNFNEISKYTGVLKARNLETFRQRLADKGMLHLADDFFKASGSLSAQCYKLEIEAAMRSEYIAGFQLLDLQDFSGQGTALVGMLDAFMDSKNIISSEDWCGFCSDAVILAEINDFISVSGENFSADVKFRYMGDKPLSDIKIIWRACDGDNILAYGELQVPDNAYGLVDVGTLEFVLPKVESSRKVTLELMTGSSRDSKYPTGYTKNKYELWVYPKPLDAYSISGKSMNGNSTVYLSESFDEVKSLLAAGESVIYFPNELAEAVKGFYCTDFWCYPMFRSISESMGKEVPVGTLGLLINNEHKALSGFESEFYSTPQWYNIVSHSDCAVLDNTPLDYRPIVQIIDNFERNHKLGLLYEATVGKGKLLVCTSRLSEISYMPEVQAFAASILKYAHSDEFKPKFTLSFKELCLKDNS